MRRYPFDAVNTLGVYLHVPFCESKCPYCAFYSVPAGDPASLDAYLEAINRESRHRWSRLPPATRPSSVYIGGGTPSLLSVRQWERLCAMIHKVFRPARDTEWSVECNPGSLNREKLSVLAAAGVNRISLGAQSLDDDILRALGRRHQVSDVCHAVDAIHAMGIENWNLDLIACVPGVGERRWQNVLRQAAGLAPAHCSVYALTLEEGRALPVTGTRRAPAVMDDERQLRMLRLTHARLREHGYDRYEISNYARPGRRCRHHLDGWYGCDYLGFGPSAVSRRGAWRRRNVADACAYLKTLRKASDAPHESERLSSKGRTAERLVFGLRCLDGVPLDGMDPVDGTPPRADEWPGPAVRALQRQGMIWKEGNRIGLTSRGLELADAVALELWPGDGCRSHGKSDENRGTRAATITDYEKKFPNRPP